MSLHDRGSRVKEDTPEMSDAQGCHLKWKAEVLGAISATNGKI